MFRLASTPFRILKVTAVLTVAAFLFVGHSTIHMGGDFEAEAGCRLVARSLHGGHANHAVCPMKVGEHLSWWNKTFIGIPTGESLVSLLLLMGALLCAVAYRFTQIRVQLEFSYVLYGYKDPPENRLRDYFLQLLAAGKAQPLLYA